MDNTNFDLVGIVEDLQGFANLCARFPNSSLDLAKQFEQWLKASTRIHTNEIRRLNKQAYVEDGPAGDGEQHTVSGSQSEATGKAKRTKGTMDQQHRHTTAASDRHNGNRSISLRTTANPPNGVSFSNASRDDIDAASTNTASSESRTAIPQPNLKDVNTSSVTNIGLHRQVKEQNKRGVSDHDELTSEDEPMAKRLRSSFDNDITSYAVSQSKSRGQQKRKKTAPGQQKRGKTPADTPLEKPLETPSETRLKQNEGIAKLLGKLGNDEALAAAQELSDNWNLREKNGETHRPNLSDTNCPSLVYLWIQVSGELASDPNEKYRHLVRHRINSALFHRVYNALTKEAQLGCSSFIPWADKFLQLRGEKIDFPDGAGRGHITHLIDRLVAVLMSLSDGHKLTKAKCRNRLRNANQEGRVWYTLIQALGWEIVLLVAPDVKHHRFRGLGANGEDVLIREWKKAKDNLPLARLRTFQDVLQTTFHSSIQRRFNASVKDRKVTALLKDLLLGHKSGEDLQSEDQSEIDHSHPTERASGGATPDIGSTHGGSDNSDADERIPDDRSSDDSDSDSTTGRSDNEQDPDLCRGPECSSNYQDDDGNVHNDGGNRDYSNSLREQTPESGANDDFDDSSTGDRNDTTEDFSDSDSEEDPSMEKALKDLVKCYG